MRKSEVKPVFNMSYGALMQLGDLAVALITRDAAELATYGIDAATKTFISTTTEALKDFPSDEEYEGHAMVTTETKNKTADDLKVVVRSIMVRAKNGFGENSGKYRRFGTIGMNEMNDNDLLKLGKRVVRVATIMQPALADKGLTVAIIADLNVIVTQFDTSIGAQDDAIREREIATEDRIELGNLLYKKIVEVFDSAKDYWVTREEAKYNDYIIYNIPGGAG